MLNREICETSPLMPLVTEKQPSHHEPARHAPVASWGRLCALLLLLVLVPKPAGADGEEPLLWLAIQRGGAIDGVGSEQVREQLAGRKELRVVESTLTDADRRCRTAACLSALARQHQAYVVLSGDIFQLGSKKSQRVVMHLYDGRHRQVFDVENLCNDCDETKLGLLVQSTVNEILGRYHKGQDADAQLNELIDGSAKNGPPAIPSPSSDPVMVPPLVTTPPTPPPLANTAAQAAPAAPVGSRPQLAPMPVAKPQESAKVQLAPTPVVSQPPQTPVAPPPLPPQGTAPTLAGSYVPQLPAPAQSAPVPPPQYQTQAPLWTQPAPVTAPVPRKGLSTKRKALAAVFGTLGFAALGGTIAAHYFDKKLDATLLQNPGGLPCSSPANAGQNCVLTTVGLWAPGYAVSGLLIGGMILSLAIPEK